MQFACIAPTAYLDQYAGRGHFQLCLAQVAMRDPKYFEWYKRRREAGDFVILDNGAYEGELVDAKELIRISEALNPNVLTVPDKINDFDESERLHDDFMKQANEVKQFGWPQFMRVLQSESRDIEEWAEIVDNTPSQWIALPRVLGSDFRIEVANYIRDTQVRYVHAFGWTGNLNEVRALSKLGVTSIDTSAPVWRALNGVALKDELDIDWEGTGAPPYEGIGEKFNPHYLDPTSMKQNEKLIDSNLQAMQRACVAF